MKRSDFDWRSGDVVHWDLDPIDSMTSVRLRPWNFHEDLAQVAYSNGRIIDIGWYPSGSVEGAFVIQLILGSDWVNPLATLRCATLTELRAAIPRFVERAEAR